jgi:hypothetical protein
MPRQPRHFEPKSLVEVTTRAIHGRLLLRPSTVFNEIFLGTLGYAQARYDLDVHLFVALSNHYHLLCSPENPDQLRCFMRLFNSKLAREIGRLHGWREKVWGRRYQPIVVSDEPEAQIGRLKYLLSHGVKEGFVASPGDWPGVHCVGALLHGKALQGLWFDRTLEYEANRQGVEFGMRDFASVHAVTLSRLPCWRHLTESEYRSRIQEIVDQIEEESRIRQRETGRPPLGAAFVLRQNPQERPSRSKRSPAPLVHAASKAVRKSLVAGYRAFVSAYRRASEQLRSGDPSVAFPPHCFPPPFPYVRGSPSFASA